MKITKWSGCVVLGSVEVPVDGPDIDIDLSVRLLIVKPDDEREKIVHLGDELRWTNR